MHEKKEKNISVFFSYGHDCEEIVLRIKKDLCELGFEVWIDSGDIKIGKDWREAITSGIMNSDSVMAFFSKHSLRKGGVCLNELSIAVGCKYGYIKTVLLEPDVEHLIPSTVSGIQYCDMSRWRILKEQDPAAFESWYQEKLEEIISVLSSTSVVEMNSQIKYLEQMLSPAMWQSKQQFVLQKQYIPRIEAEQALEKWITNPNGSKVFLLYGEPGSGKSSFLINYHHFNHESAAIAFCDWKRNSRDKLSEIIRTIAFQLAVKIPSYRASLVWHLENKSTGTLDLDAEALFEFLIVDPFVGSICLANEIHLILIDSLNELNTKNRNYLAEIISNTSDRLPAFLRFVITARKGSVISYYFPHCDSYEFLPTSDSANATIRAYYETQLEDILKNYSEGDAERILDILSQKTEGNFLYAELCTKAICEGKMSLNNLSAVPSDLNGIYYKWFVTLFSDEETYIRCYYKPLSVLCSVDDPVPLDLLKAIIGCSTAELNVFLRVLKDFLKCQENAFGKMMATLFHSSMKQWLLSENAGCFEIDKEKGLKLLKEKLFTFFDNETITPYQCKLLISVVEKTNDNVLRKRIYGSPFFFKQYYILAKSYQTIRGGYHKAILIFTHLREICEGLPSQENRDFLQTVYPFEMGRCFCQVGDYYATEKLLAEHLPSLEANLRAEDLMETYYILGSVYDWSGERAASVEIFTKLNKIAEAENNPSYQLRAIIGLVWNEHFTKVDTALTRLDYLSSCGALNEIDRQMAELVSARILLSTGELEKALAIYDRHLSSFDFTFQNDVRGYRKNRLMLIEILPACYDMSNYEKGIETGIQILRKIKGTGYLEECYCSSWIALNYLGIGDIISAEQYLNKAIRYFDAMNNKERSCWMAMHLCSVEAFLLSEKGLLEDALCKHNKVARLAADCNDVWVEGDACFEICKLILLYNLKPIADAKLFINKLLLLADTSALPHLILKANLITILYNVLETTLITEEQEHILERLDCEKSLASTNYIDVYCIKAIIYKTLDRQNEVREAIRCIRELIFKPEYKNRPSSWKIAEHLQKGNSPLSFCVEYCDPYNNEYNYWMRLEHLGRYLWACDECSKKDRAIVADIACANGYGSLLLSKFAEWVYAFDRSSEYIRQAHKKDYIEYVCCDLDLLPPDTFEDTFDVIVSFETIEHVKFPQRLIHLFWRMLKKNGVLLISFPNALYEKMDEYGLNKDLYHLHVFEKDTIISMLQNSGFEVTDVLGQSYCNVQCNKEINDVKEGKITPEKLSDLHKRSAQLIESEARQYAIPNKENIHMTYSYILRCEKREQET